MGSAEPLINQTAVVHEHTFHAQRTLEANRTLTSILPSEASKRPSIKTEDAVHVLIKHPKTDEVNGDLLRLQSI